MSQTRRTDAFERAIGQYGDPVEAALRWARKLEIELAEAKGLGVPPMVTGRPLTVEELKAMFDEARKSYPGVKRGLNTEWANFSRKWAREAAGVVPLLLTAIHEEGRFKVAQKAAGGFMPPWANFQTWINQRRWEQEHPWATLQGARAGAGREKVAGSLSRRGEHDENLAL